MGKEIKAVIFDFNGTLFYDTDFHNQAWQEFARRYNRKLTVTEMERHVHGFTNKEILSYIFGKEIQGEQLSIFSSEKEKLYRDTCERHPTRCVLTPGASDFLDFLKERNIPRTIATASVWENVEFFIHQFQLVNWFDTSRIVYDNGDYRGKPHPDMFLAAAGRLGVPASNCMIIEDSPGGLQAARNAGAGKIVAFSPLKDYDKPKGFTFIDFQIDHFSQIPLDLFLC